MSWHFVPAVAAKLGALAVQWRISVVASHSERHVVPTTSFSSGTVRFIPQLGLVGRLRRTQSSPLHINHFMKRLLIDTEANLGGPYFVVFRTMDARSDCRMFVRSKLFVEQRLPMLQDGRPVCSDGPGLALHESAVAPMSGLRGERAAMR